MSRHQRSLPILRLLAGTVLVIFGSPGGTIDLGPWARPLRQHGDWNSLDFRNPATGLFFASRAGTEDARTQATLTFTAYPERACEPDIVVVLKTGVPAAQDSEKLALVAVRVDGRAPTKYPARIVIPRDDIFVFVQLLEPIPTDRLNNRATIAIRLPNARHAAFSLAGFESAWNAALESCLSFRNASP